MINRRFAIPALCSLSLHSVLFLGVAKPPMIIPLAVARPSRPPVITPIEDVYIPPADPEKSTENVPSARRGDMIPPGEFDIPRPANPGDFLIEVAPPTEASKSITTHIGIIGVPWGTIDGETLNATRPSVISVNSLDRTPMVRAQETPRYPDSAKKEGLTGTVDVEFIVGPAGDVRNVQILSATNPVFEEPTRRAISKWRFEPGRKDGQVVSFRMRQPITFSLGD